LRRSCSESSGKPSSGRSTATGFLAVNNPQVVTSHDGGALVRRRLGAGKVGQAGTLDPMAEGVVVLGVGRSATKDLHIFMQDEKEYEAVMVLGVSTDSQDATGKVVSRRDPGIVSEEAVRRVLEKFTGAQRQVPPMYSAVKQNGRPLYTLARRGVVVPRDSRPIHIYALDLGGIAGREVQLRVRCSKGTYVRTLCADIGDELGCGGHLKSLVRTRVGRFTLRDAVRLDDIRRMPPDEIERRLLPVGSESGTMCESDVHES